jgi:HD-like signal output (HDOD) protein
MSLETLFAQPATLPVDPKVVGRMMKSLGEDSVTLTDVAAQLGQDPVLSAKTLRLANSAYFRLQRQVGTIEEALQMLGFKMVHNLVVSAAAVSAFKSAPGIDLPAFWRYSLNTACASRWLLREAEQDAELGFLVGLTHGLGHLVMHNALPAAMQQLDRDVHPLAAERALAERDLLGYHHGDVSAELARRWNFPQAVSDALRQVPLPLESEPLPTLAAWVHLGAWRARVEHFHWPAEQVAAEVPAAVGAALHRPAAWLAASARPERVYTGGLPLMPVLAELTEGLDAMLA